MITKHDAILIGTSACKVADRFSTEQNDTYRHLGRGTVLYILDALWYDVLPQKVRQQFGSLEAYYKACGWPE